MEQVGRGHCEKLERVVDVCGLGTQGLRSAGAGTSADGLLRLPHVACVWSSQCLQDICGAGRVLVMLLIKTRPGGY